MNRRTAVSVVTSLALMFVMAAALCSCGRNRGEFAVKKNLEDRYVRVNRRARLEFSPSDRIQWVYVFPEEAGERTYGIVLLRKEVVWVDVETKTGFVGEEKNVLYGSCTDLREGDYRLLILKGNVKIDEMKFAVYGPAERNEYR